MADLPVSRLCHSFGQAYVAAHATDFSLVHKAVRHQCMEVTGLNDFGNAVTEMIKNAPVGTLLVERPMTPNEHLNKFCLNFPMQVYEKKT